MNSLTKSVVIVSTLVAAFSELYLASYGFAAIWIVGLTGFVAAVACGAWARGVVTRTILFAIYLAPAGWLLWFGFESYSFEIAWVIPALGLMVSDRGTWRWSLPERWRLPLVAWALIVSISWPIVAMRELSFSLGMLDVVGASTSRGGIAPWDSAVWVIYMVLGHNIGLLWIDTLFRWYADERSPRFRREILWPLAAAATVACLIGAYQGFVRIGFLSGHLWPHMNRAAGTLMDANTFGTIAAFWGSGMVALLLAGGGRWAVPLATTGFCLAFVGVWTSGSRTALASFGLASLAVFHYAWKAWRSGGSRPRSTKARMTLVLAGALAAVGAVMLIARGSSTTTVFARIPSLVPGLENTTVGSAAVQLWERFGYGTAAMRMMVDHPLEGVGVGSFHTLVRDYGTLVTNRDLPPDNAQNWYRHVLAELGLLGGFAAIAWSVLFARRLLSTPWALASDPAHRMVGSFLLAFGVLSLLGMPGQSPSVILTFWTFVYWFFSTRESIEPAQAPAGSDSWPLAVWAPVFLLVALHASLTYASARGDLLPQHRAERFGWDYNYGISDLEPSPDGSPGRRWTAERSLSTIPVQGRVLKFVAWAEHPDANEKPVHLRVVADSKVVFEGDLRRASAIYVDIPATPGAKELVLETWIDRTFRPSNYGSRDRRDLGLAIQDWRWEN